MKKNELVVKSNRIVEASYRLTLNEQRIILYAICRAREEQRGLFPNEPVTITAEMFAKQFPSTDKKNVYEQLQEAMNNLFERSVLYHDIDPATNLPRVNKTRWISKASYINGAGHIQVVFTQAVIEHITRLELEFTSYALEKVGNMTSAHAIRIYEILAQYKDVGRREVQLKWLREALQFSPNEYKLTTDLRKYVIDAAVLQINKHTDLRVSYTPKKTSRAITSFEFTIKNKEKKAKEKAPKEKAPDQLKREQLESLGQRRIDEFDEQF